MAKLVIVLVLVAVIFGAGYVVVNSMDANGQVDSAKAQSIMEEETTRLNEVFADTVEKVDPPQIGDDLFNMWMAEWDVFVTSLQAGYDAMPK